MKNKDILLQVFDMDDTLVISNAINYINETKSGKTQCVINSGQFRDIKNFIFGLQKKKIIEIDYSEYSNTKISYKLLQQSEKIIKYMCKLNSAYHDKNQKVAIITARGNSPQQIHNFFKELYDINIPVNMIKCMNWSGNNVHNLSIESQDELEERLLRKYRMKKEYYYLKRAKEKRERKKLAMFSFIDQGYRKINFYDDDTDNTDSMKTLKRLKTIDKSKYGDLDLSVYFVPEKEHSNLHKIVENRTRKHLKQYIYPNGSICKNFLKKYNH